MLLFIFSIIVFIFNRVSISIEGPLFSVALELALELEEDEFFVADLIGLDVFTVDGEKVGVVKDVLQHAINDVYVVNNGEKEYLIPSIEKFVPTIDLEENKMIINPIKGMLD